MKPDPCVYIVDDDPAMIQAFESLIDVIGYEKETYLSAEEFLLAYDPQRTGCLLLDVRLSGMSGLDLQLELAKRGSRLPIIFMTGHADESIAAEAMKHGAVGFLEKPFRPQELFDSIKEAIAMAGQD